ncbi:MAG: hypothetical protein J4A00_07380 [Gammaproteobacteria bacterium]|nr:hypothetical protein [Gammaproteobacteria bacterium]
MDQLAHNRRLTLSGLLCSAVLVMGGPSAQAEVTGLQVIDVFTDSLTKVADNMYSQQLPGDFLGVESFRITGGSRPYSDGASHNHAQEYIFIQFAGTSKYVIQGGEKSREYNVDRGAVMHMPPGLQHRGGHGADDAVMLTVFSPPRRTEAEFNYTPPAVTGDLPLETRDLYTIFDMDSAELVEDEEEWLYSRHSLGKNLGLEYLLIKKEMRTDYIVSARAAPLEEVAIIYQGEVKVTGCGEARILRAGQAAYCRGAMMYTGLRADDARLLRIFTPGKSEQLNSMR